MSKFFGNVFGHGSWMMLAPEGAGEGTGEEVEIEASAEPETEYVEEGSEEAEGVTNSEEKSIEEIQAELAQTREKLAAFESGSKPIETLNSTMERFMQSNAPAKPARKDGASAGITQTARLSDTEFEKRYNQLMLENPLLAQKEYSERLLEPVLQTVAVNQAQVSRELLLANPENKKIYDRFADEIEEAVSAVPVYDRLKNPKVYQQALTMVKAAHSDELVSESVKAQIDAGVAEALKAYGIDPTKVKPAQKPAAFNAPQSVLGRPAQETSTGVKRIVIPAWVAEEARVKGVDRGFLYEKYKREGRVK